MLLWVCLGLVLGVIFFLHSFGFMSRQMVQGSRVLPSKNINALQHYGQRFGEPTNHDSLGFSRQAFPWNNKDPEAQGDEHYLMELISYSNLLLR